MIVIQKETNATPFLRKNQKGKLVVKSFRKDLRGEDLFSSA